MSCNDSMKEKGSMHCYFAEGEEGRNIRLPHGSEDYVTGVAIVTPSAVGRGLSFILAVIAKTCGREREEGKQGTAEGGKTPGKSASRTKQARAQHEEVGVVKSV